VVFLAMLTNRDAEWSYVSKGDIKHCQLQKYLFYESLQNNLFLTEKVAFFLYRLICNYLPENFPYNYRIFTTTKALNRLKTTVLLLTVPF
jgi:hypothetical protein